MSSAFRSAARQAGRLRTRSLASLVTETIWCSVQRHPSVSVEAIVRTRKPMTHDLLGELCEARDNARELGMTRTVEDLQAAINRLTPS